KQRSERRKINRSNNIVWKNSDNKLKILNRFKKKASFSPILSKFMAKNRQKYAKKHCKNTPENVSQKL
ncbi:MAG: hypothetical protein K2H36_04675, partial [Clostridia bacterium]|nr:hypothetical protein [Clostridia bacterium]